MPNNNLVDLSIERRVAHFFCKNIDHNNGMFTPDYCMDLISRTSVAEATLSMVEEEKCFYQEIATAALAVVKEIADMEPGMQIVSPAVHRAQRFIAEINGKEDKSNHD